MLYDLAMFMKPVFACVKVHHNNQAALIDIAAPIIIIRTDQPIFVIYMLGINQTIKNATSAIKVTKITVLFLPPHNCASFSTQKVLRKHTI